MSTAMNGFCIRQAFESDLSALVSLERISWPSPLKGLSELDVLKRLQSFKQGQLVAVCEDSGRLVAYLSTQRICSIEKLRAGSVNFLTAPGLHVETGPVWQFLSLLVDPEFASSEVGDALFKYALMVAGTIPGVREIAAVTRCRFWRQAKNACPDLSIDEYLASGNDAGIRWHKDRGAQVVAAVAKWRAEDEDNLSIGVLVQYKLNRVSDQSAYRSSSQRVSQPVSQPANQSCELGAWPLEPAESCDALRNGVNSDGVTLLVEQPVQRLQPNAVTNDSVEVKRGPLLQRWGASVVDLTQKSRRVQGKGEPEKGVKGVLEKQIAKSLGSNSSEKLGKCKGEPEKLGKCIGELEKLGKCRNVRELQIVSARL